MSREIDERVVEMRMDNNQFERAAEKTLRTLDNLKDAVTFNGLSSGADEVQAAMNGLDFDTLAGNIQTLTDHFSAFGIIGDQVMRRIGNAIADMGFKIASTVKDLTIGQVDDGFVKYEANVENVQKIMNSVNAKTEEEKKLVYDIADKVAWFSDETSYDTQSMMKYLGDFVANGVDLKDAATNIIGVANAAGYAGVNTQMASHAMMGFARALGSGKMTSNAWQFIHTAGMDTASFKQNLMDAAVTAGKLRKSLNGVYTTTKGTTVSIDNMASTFSEGWLTKEAIVSTLKLYGDTTEQIYKMYDALEGEVPTSKIIEDNRKALEGLGLDAFYAAQQTKTFKDAINAVRTAVSSKWSKSFELIIGNYDEARDLWSNFVEYMWDIFVASGDARNEILKEWHDLGGRDDLVAGLTNSLELLVTAIDKVKEAFHSIFPKATADNLANLTKRFKDFTELITGTQIKADMETIKERGLDPALVMEGTGYDKKLDKIEHFWDRIQRVLKGVFAIFDVGKQAIGSFLSAISPLVKFSGKVADSFLTIAANIGDWLVSVDEAAKAGDVFTAIFTRIKTTLQPITSFIGGIIEFMTSKLRELTGNEGLTNAINKLKEYAPSLEQVSKPFEMLHDIFDRFFSWLSQQWPVVKPIFESIGAIISKYLTELSTSIKNADFTSILQFGKALLSFRFMESLTWIGESMTSWADALWGIAYKFKAEALVNAAKALLIFAGAMFVMALIPGDKLMSVMIAMEVAMSMFRKSLANISVIASDNKFKFGGLEIATIATSLISIASAMLILSIALKLMSTIDPNALYRGILAVGLLLTELSVSMGKLTSFKSAEKKVVSGLVGIASAMVIISFAVKKMGEMDGEAMARGVLAVGLILAALSVAFKHLQSIDYKEGRIKATTNLATGFVSLAASIVIISYAIDKLGNMDPNAMARGIVGIGLVLAALAGFIKVANGTKGMTGAAVGMLILSGAMLIFVKAIEALGTMDMTQLGVGLFGLSVAIIGIATGLAILSEKALGAIGAAAAILVLSVAIGMLVPSIILLGSVPMEVLGAGLLGIALAFVILGTAAAILTPVIPAMLGAAAAFALLGVGAIALSAGLTGLAAAFVASVGAGKTAVTILLSAIQDILIAIPTLVGAFVEAVATASAKLFGTLLENAAVYGPQIIGNVVLLIANLLTVISTYIPILVEAGLTLIEKFIYGLARGVIEHSDRIIKVLENLMAALIYVLLTGLQEMARVIPIIGGGIADKIGDLKENIKENLADIDFSESLEASFVDAEGTAKDGASKIVEASVKPFDDNLMNYKSAAKGAAIATVEGYEETAIPGMEAAVSKLTDIGIPPEMADKYTLLGIDSGTAQMEGYQSTSEDIIGVTNEVADASVQTMSDKNKDFYKAGAGNIISDGQGMESKRSWIITKSTSISNSAASAADNYQGFYNAGAHSGQGLVDGLASKEEAVSTAATNLAKIARRATEGTLEINSPSRVMYRIGEYATMGLANGMTAVANLVKQAGYAVSTEAIQSMSGIARGVNSSISNLDVTPTIRPVLDTSKVYSGARGISTMLDAERVNMTAAAMEVTGNQTQLDALVDMTAQIYRQLQNGQNLYLDDGIIAGRINRRLGLL